MPWSSREPRLKRWGTQAKPQSTRIDPDSDESVGSILGGCNTIKPPVHELERPKTCGELDLASEKALITEDIPSVTPKASCRTNPKSLQVHVEDRFRPADPKTASRCGQDSCKHRGSIRNHCRSPSGFEGLLGASGLVHPYRFEDKIQ